MSNHNYCIIMAGGIGSRFWPLSRINKPKQFLDILGIGKTLLQQTYERFVRIIPPENIYIVSNQEYGPLIEDQVPDLPKENILLEPFRRNTAPCIAYATYRLRTRDPEANMVVAPSDHLILKEDKFLEVVKEGLNFVRSHNALLTLGIKPSRPETGYGYIQTDRTKEIKISQSVFRRIKTFTEKPDYELAKIFYESGDFFWNAGIFFWSLDTITESIEKYLPDIYSSFEEGIGIYGTAGEAEFIGNTYSGCKNISIDYGIMEKADNVYVMTSDIGWSDLGTWGSLYEQKEKDENENAIVGDSVFLYDVKNSVIIDQEDKIVVIQGLDNYIIVESDDVLLICRKEDEQRIKLFVHDVRIKKGEKYI
jgi:mannose-1-phosphate guanylyltransferase